MFMEYYTGITLVDITATGVTHHRPGKEFLRDQHRNWETVLQVISLKAQPQYIDGPYINEVNIDDNNIFGEMYAGMQKTWMFSFGIESTDVWNYNNDPVYKLYEDFAQVPIIMGLEETARFILPIFYPYGALKNIHFIPGKLK